GVELDFPPPLHPLTTRISATTTNAHASRSARHVRFHEGGKIKGRNMLRTASRYGTQDTSVKVALVVSLAAAGILRHGVRAVASSGVRGDVQNAQRVASATMSLLHSGHSRMSGSGSSSDAI